MNNDTVQIWLYDTTDGNKLIGTIRVPRGSELTVGQTAVKPKGGLYGLPKFDEDKQEWFGMTKEEWLKTNPFHDRDQSTQPSPQQEMMATLMKQNANLQKEVKAQATVNANIMKNLAELKAKAQ